MPRRPAIARERLAQLLHLPATGIAHALGCTPNHVNVLLRQHGFTCAPADCGRPAGIHFTPGPEQQAVMEQFQTSRTLVSGLARAVGCTPARLFAELSGRVPMPEQRVAALAQLLAT
jgi:hypothetical protein